MRPGQQFTITLPYELAEVVRAKVASGEYATESEIIREGLRALFAREQAIEHWLHTDVATAYDKLEEDPLRALTPQQLRDSLAKKRQQRDGDG
ncbi:MAG TPA: type II toxin-antitoxin system ParD family antitoxin [Rhodanobacteraceae bacterium]|nr:type II toxin-antitoxin system ParD family antitoxin [Rhodanobacteraceae bacterium]